jgi:2-aminoadipate transaminase
MPTQSSISSAQPSVVQFARGIPPLEAIATTELTAQAEAVLEERNDIFQYAPLGRNQGDPNLRDQLGAFHGVAAEDIFVGNGSLQVLDLLAGYFLKNRRALVYVEAPTYDRAIEIFERHGAEVVGIPLEADGLDIECLQRRLASDVPALLYTIPDFQNPAGVTLSLEKRKALVDLAATHGFTILEDIPYRELRYHGTAPALLRELSDRGAVITIASLSKILSPGLRIGYAISNKNTSQALAGLAEGTYLSPVPFCQAVAARSFATGLVDSSIKRVRELLRPRHDQAMAAAQKWLGDNILCIPNGGYYLGVRLRTDMMEASFLKSARAEGVVLTRGSGFYSKSQQPGQGTLFLRLPFQALDPAEFAKGLERLVKVAETAEPQENAVYAGGPA